MFFFFLFYVDRKISFQNSNKKKFKTFKKWINIHLPKEVTPVTDLSTDLSNGIILIELLINLFPEKLQNNSPKYNKSPKMLLHNLDNMTMAFKLLETAQIDVNDIKPQSTSQKKKKKEDTKTLVLFFGLDIVDGEIKMIMGLIWKLILEFQMRQLPNDPSKLRFTQGDSMKSSLLYWCQQKLKHNPEIQVKDFKTRLLIFFSSSSVLKKKKKLRLS